MDITNLKLLYKLYESTHSIVNKGNEKDSINDFMQLCSNLCRADSWLAVYNNTHDDELRCIGKKGVYGCKKSLLIDVLPLLFQSSALDLLGQAATKIIIALDEIDLDKQLSSSFYANIELTEQESVFLIFFRKAANQDFCKDDLKDFSVLRDFIELFLKSLVSSSQSDKFVTELRSQVRRQNIWMEALSWINQAEVTETEEHSTEEFYQGLLFQLSTLMHVDAATIFEVQNDGPSLVPLDGHGKLKVHVELIKLVERVRKDEKLRRHSFWISDSSNAQQLDLLGYSQVVLLPLFLQKNLSYIVCVVKKKEKFDTNDMAIGRLFSEGVEKIIERRWLLGSINEHVLALQAEKEEQKSLIAQLNEMQGQVLQNEKMASIGQLAAGVAHEINNPVGYFSSNLGSLTSYIKEIFELLECYQNLEKLCPKDSLELIKVNQMKEEVDVSFLKEDIEDLLSESLEGVTRVREIVQNLKDFSHVDEAEWQTADIHQGLDSTLNIVANELKYKAEIVKDYAEIPNIECMPSQLNQVFMNMLVNAGHAIEKQGTITIRTKQKDSETIIVEFSDSGKGIKEEDISRIFEPFFTTKPIGKGTGLGLSLSYGIIDKHSGKLSVVSKLGVGTTFRIELPVHQSEKKADC